MQAFEVVGKYVLEGVDAVEKGFRAIDKGAQRTVKAVEAAGKRIESLGKTVGSVGAGMSKWVTTSLTAAAVGAVSLGVKLGETAGRFSDLSDITGMSTRAIQEWQFIADKVGTSTEAITLVAHRLNGKLGQLRAGVGGISVAFGRLGIDTNSFLNMSSDDRINTLITRLQNVKDEALRAEIGTQIFPEAWRQIAPIVAATADGIRDMRAESTKYILSEDEISSAADFETSIKDLKREFSLLVQEISIKLIPVMRDQLMPLVEKHLIPKIKAAADTVVELIDAFNKLPEPIQELIVGVTALVAVLGPLMVVFGPIISAIGRLVSGFGLLARGLAIVPLLTNPVTLTILAIVAALTAMYAIFKNFDEISTVVSKAFGVVKNAFSDFISTITEFVGTLAGRVWEALSEFGRNLVETFVNAFNSAVESLQTFMGKVVAFFAALPRRVVTALLAFPQAVMRLLKQTGDAMIAWAKDVVDKVVARFKAMYKAIVGNSIVPDMRQEVGVEFKRMSDESIGTSSRMVRSVNSKMMGLDSDIVPSSGSRSAQRSASGGQSVYVDMRHSILRDDRDLTDRLMRNGQGMVGGLA